MNSFIDVFDIDCANSSIGASICSWLDIPDISNLLLASRSLWTKLTQRRIKIEKMVRNCPKFGIMIHTRSVDIFDVTENIFTQNNNSIRIYDFQPICVNMYDDDYIIYVNKYCQARIIVNYVDNYPNSIHFHDAIHVFMIKEYIDIFKIMKLFDSVIYEPQMIYSINDTDNDTDNEMNVDEINYSDVRDVSGENSLDQYFNEEQAMYINEANWYDICSSPDVVTLLKS